MEVKSRTPIAGAEADDQLRSQDEFFHYAEWLHLLVHGQKHRGITVTSEASRQVALGRKCARANLSAFIASSGRVRNLNHDTIESVLHSLGMHTDGLLTPGIHRWDLAARAAAARAGSGRLLATLCEVLRTNTGDVATLLSLTWKSGATFSPTAFVVARPNAVTSLMVRLDHADVDALMTSLRDVLATRELDQGEAAELQSSWKCTAHEWVLGEKIEALLEHKNNLGPVTRPEAA